MFDPLGNQGYSNKWQSQGAEKTAVKSTTSSDDRSCASELGKRRLGDGPHR
jgi:hypothetical protein